MLNINNNFHKKSRYLFYQKEEVIFLYSETASEIFSVKKVSLNLQLKFIMKDMKYRKVYMKKPIVQAKHIILQIKLSII